MILKWDKPEQVMSKESWQGISADGAPPGVYCPNMSDEDQQAWKAKLVGKRSGIKQVEIRKTTSNHTQMLLIVSNDGFRRKVDHWHPDGKEFPGRNVRISLNGPAAFTFEEMEQMALAIEEARQILQELEK